jgi:hypothetical protein
MSYRQLVNILAESVAEVQDARSQPPVACPRDGQPLEVGKYAGTLHCRFCGFVYPQDWNSYGNNA